MATLSFVEVTGATDTGGGGTGLVETGDWWPPVRSTERDDW